MLRIGKRREEYFAVAQAALLEAKHRKSIGNPGEKRLMSETSAGNPQLEGIPAVLNSLTSPSSQRSYVHAATYTTRAPTPGNLATFSASNAAGRVYSSNERQLAAAATSSKQ
jgi:hypothetical protein